MSNHIHYVLLHVFDPTMQVLVGLTKLKGPAMLLNKLTVPGGKIEASESIGAAASREMLEETGLSIPDKNWVIFEKITEEGYTLNKLVAVSAQAKDARTMEEEPVCLLNVEAHQSLAKINPQLYSPDFLPNLEKALKLAANQPN